MAESGLILLGADDELPNMPMGWEYKLNAPRTPKGLWEAFGKNTTTGELCRRFGRTQRLAMEALRARIAGGDHDHGR